MSWGLYIRTYPFIIDGQDSGEFYGVFVKREPMGLALAPKSITMIVDLGEGRHLYNNSQIPQTYRRNWWIRLYLVLNTVRGVLAGKNYLSTVLLMDTVLYTGHKAN